MMTTQTIDQGFDGDAMRRLMVASQLRTSGVSDARVVAAMSEVPREAFMPEHARGLAYRDTDIPLGKGRRQNAPLATARLLNEARILPGHRVLLIGAASGYTAAVLALVAREVVAIECDPVLANVARSRLAGVASVRVVEAPLAAGAADGAPYDVMVIDGAVEAVPDTLAEQVRPGGRIVAGLVDNGVTRLAMGERTVGGVGLVDFADMACTLLPGFTKPRSFRF